MPEITQKRGLGHTLYKYSSAHWRGIVHTQYEGER